jgi:hypothetical protein
MKINFNFPKPQEGIYVPHTVGKWYNRSERSWVIQVKDKYGNQIGEADSVHSREEAEAREEYQRNINGL